MNRIFDYIAEFWVLWRVMDEVNRNAQAKRDGDGWQRAYTRPMPGPGGKVSP